MPWLPLENPSASWSIPIAVTVFARARAPRPISTGCSPGTCMSTCPRSPRSRPALLTQLQTVARLPGRLGDLMFALLLTLLILDALLLSVVVLLQAGQGGGLASLGGATTDTVLGGRQAVTILTKLSW